MTTLDCLDRVAGGGEAALVVVSLVQRGEIVACDGLARGHERRTAEVSKARDWLGAVQCVDGLGLGSHGGDIVTWVECVPGEISAVAGSRWGGGRVWVVSPCHSYHCLALIILMRPSLLTL